MKPPSRTIGPWKVSAMGLGCMQLSGMSTVNAPILDDSEQAFGVIHAALDAGVTLLDTADIYAPSWDTFGHNESLVGAAFKSWDGSHSEKAKVVIATKGGITRGPDESWGKSSALDYLLQAVENSTTRLGVEKIQLWQHHRLDPTMIFEDQFENVLKLQSRGLVERIGVSNYNAEQLRRAVKIGGAPAQGGLVSVQNEFSPRYRHEAEVLEICEEYGIAYLPWSPLGGIRNAGQLTGGNFSTFGELGQQKGVSAFAMTIAWLLHLSPTMIPIPGTTRVSSLLDDLEGVDISLTADEMKYLNSSLPESAPIDDELLEQPPFRY
ncbi:MAG: aldo/keto reductase [Candidatus Nanopelagicaceae bacterium]|nr:aldo/keto reductase [Candidatus Nanopelagicaceae bacterium]